LLSLSEAIRTGRLSDFVAQEEARGIGPANRDDFDLALKAIVKEPQSANRTSRSASGDGSSAKRTRRGSGPYISR